MFRRARIYYIYLFVDNTFVFFLSSVKMSVRRNIKNVVYNYSEAARKAREATSNDPWGPSTTLMQEVADLTYDMIAYSDIMPIIWKRLNDHGKNWRHVYKSLVLLDYLVRYGCKRITQQCKENIFVIQTLKDFQYIEGNKDQGLNVREKAKQLVSLLKDDERLKNERAKAEALRQRMSVRNPMGDSLHHQHHFTDSSNNHRYRNSRQPYKTTGYYSSSFSAYDGVTYPSERSFDSKIAKDYAAPTNAEEEAIQMQLALALSKEEAQTEEFRRNSELDRRHPSFGDSRTLQKTGKNASENDLIGIFDSSLNMSSKNLGQHDTLLVNRPVSANPWISQPSNNSRLDNDDVWGTPSAPWTPLSVNPTQNADWNSKYAESSFSTTSSNPAKSDPSKILDVAKELNHFLNYELTPPQGPIKFDSFTNDGDNADFKSPANSPSPSASGAVQPSSHLAVTSASSSSYTDETQTEHEQDQGQQKQQLSACPESFLGEHHNLVDLDNLADKPKPSTNPFVLSSMTSSKPTSNPFMQSQSKAPTLNELAMKNSDDFKITDDKGMFDSTLPSPLIASNTSMFPTTPQTTTTKENKIECVF
ncbi:hypothetical protein GJ496_004026 [Pomphorhynchus laevis]|nr:hypothetical protein GJ496_004026 [Pomphorhynchus laevis]